MSRDERRHGREHDTLLFCSVLEFGPDTRHPPSRARLARVPRRVETRHSDSRLETRLMFDTPVERSARYTIVIYFTRGLAFTAFSFWGGC